MLWNRAKSNLITIQALFIRWFIVILNKTWQQSQDIQNISSQVKATMNGRQHCNIFVYEKKGFSTDDLNNITMLKQHIELLKKKLYNKNP